jgi:hypothetical protein
MSELGQTRKSALATAMSAFPPIATKLRTSREVRFVPGADELLLRDRRFQATGASPLSRLPKATQNVEAIDANAETTSTDLTARKTTPMV